MMYFETSADYALEFETCDFCDAEYDIRYRHVVAFARPSDQHELVATMWGCGKCDASKDLPRASELIDLVESGQPVDGRYYLFVTV